MERFDPAFDGRVGERARRIQPAAPQAGRDVLSHRQMREQRVLLEHIGQPTLLG
jgi:hypothetical protein